MALDTFSGLKTTIADYLNRDDLTSIIPTFITLAEAKFNRKLRTRQMVKRANAPIDTQYFAYPADYLETKTFKLNTNPITVLEFATEEYSDTLRSSRFVAPGKPQFFSIIGNQLEVIPTPDAEYSAELSYYAKITALSDTNTSNWLLAYSPDLYLYGSLLEATPYLKDDERLAIWGQLYATSIEDIVLADQRASVATTPIVRARTLG